MCPDPSPDEARPSPEDKALVNASYQEWQRLRTLTTEPQIVETLGSGGFGVVYRIRDGLGQSVAIKCVRLPEGYSRFHPSEQSALEELQAEGRRLAALPRNPRIVEIKGTCLHEGRLGLVMEWLSGEPLDKRYVRKSERCSLGEMVAIGMEVAWGLAACHSAGLLHLDLKPAHIFKTTDGRFVLIDFGASRWRWESARRGQGTWPYMAPELRNGNEPTCAADIYSLGVTLYQLLTGTLPEGDVERDIEQLKSLRPEFVYLTTLHELFRQVLHPNPTERLLAIQDAGSLATRLVRLTGEAVDQLPSNSKILLTEYLTHLIPVLENIHPDGSTTSSTNPRTLNSVYVRQRVTVRIGDGEAPAGKPARGPETPDLPLLLQQVARHPCTILRAWGGMGKSTFAKILALCLARELNGDRLRGLQWLNDNAGDLYPGGHADASSVPWPHGACLPIFVSLAEFVRWARTPKENSAATPPPAINCQSLWRYLAARSEHRIAGDLGTLAIDFCRNIGALLVLDGLDETISYGVFDEDDRLVSLWKTLVDFKKMYPATRILVTSRPSAMDEVKHVLSPRLQATPLLEGGFADLELAPFSTDQKLEFCDRWFGDDTDRATKLKALISQPEYRELAESPMLLTMLSEALEKNQGVPEGGRGALYEQATEKLIDKWNQGRRLGPDPKNEKSTIETTFRLTRDQIRAALERLALGLPPLRASQGTQDHGGVFSSAEVTEALNAQVRNKRNPISTLALTEYIQDRTGILIPRGDETYGFCLPTFRDFFAGRALLNSSALPSEVKEKPIRYRAAIEFAFAAAVAKSADTAWNFLRRLIPHRAAAAIGTAQHVALAQGAFLSALCILEHPGLHVSTDPENLHREKREDVHTWLKAALVEPTLSIADRADVGDWLAKWLPNGDNRPGVLTLPRSRDDEEFWTPPIPAGRFLAGAIGKQKAPKSFQIQTSYRISRHPITNSQYEEFMRVGYGDERFWKSYKSREFLRKHPASEPLDDLKDRGGHLPNRPRIRVSWYEAMAYCAWLSERLKTEVRLPRELEWERAARGEDGREFPWGTQDVVSLRNGRDSGLRRTTAVGLYPDGKSPTEALDMSGNVWEWCQTAWREELADNPAIELVEGDPTRVLRGGSWYDLEVDGLRCAGRGGGLPVDRAEDIGFRVVAPVE